MRVNGIYTYIREWKKLYIMGKKTLRKRRSHHGVMSCWNATSSSAIFDFPFLSFKAHKPKWMKRRMKYLNWRGVKRECKTKFCFTLLLLQDIFPWNFFFSLLSFLVHLKNGTNFNGNRMMEKKTRNRKWNFFMIDKVGK